MLRNDKYVQLRDTNETAEAVPSVNRMRRIERCELECGSALEVHCLRFDMLLGCASYLEGSNLRQQAITAHKVYAYMLRCEYFSIPSHEPSHYHETIKLFFIIRIELRKTLKFY